MKRQTSGSVVCPSCGRLVGVNDEKCGNCGRTRPGMWGFAGVLRNLGEDLGFTKILCNPPYHADFAVPKEFIHKGFNRLEIGGEMILVVKRRTWYQNKLRSIFGGASVREIDGYYVLSAQKRRTSYANAAPFD